MKSQIRLDIFHAVVVIKRIWKFEDVTKVASKDALARDSREQR
jgi:hypothetical protein